MSTSTTPPPELPRPESRPGLSRRGVLTALGAGALATGAAGLALPGIAAADDEQDLPSLVPITVTTADSFTLPAKVKAGLVTFQITGGDANSHALQGFRLLAGATVEDVVQDFTTGLTGTYPQRSAGVTKLMRDAELIGGITTVPGVAQSFTTVLEPGTYHFVDYGDIGVVTPRVHSIRVIGEPNFYRLPSADTVVGTSMMSGEPRFITDTMLMAKGRYLFVNTADEFHEVMFRPTKPGITDGYITDFYHAVLAGGPVPASPWTGSQHGLQAVSPGRWAVLDLDLPAGGYAEICYVPDDELGFPHAYEGMHTMVTLS